MACPDDVHLQANDLNLFDKLNEDMCRSDAFVEWGFGE
jgi:hypothetical protein